MRAWLWMAIAAVAFVLMALSTLRCWPGMAVNVAGWSCSAAPSDDVDSIER